MGGLVVALQSFIIGADLAVPAAVQGGRLVPDRRGRAAAMNASCAHTRARALFTQFTPVTPCCYDAQSLAKKL